jgi:LacI family transcriptional regulator
MPTIKDVAKKAGVSFKTVSRVLNDDGGVRPATRDRVLEAVAALEYRPNAVARGLRMQRTHMIGFISDEIGISPFAGQMLQGAQDRAWRERVLLLSINTGRDPNLKRTAVQTLRDRQVDGIIYAAMYHREVDPPAALRNLPAVLLDCTVADGGLPSVVPNEYQGGYAAAQHLLDRGYRDIGMLNHNQPQPAATGREAGFRRALQDAGITPQEKWITHEITGIEGGYLAAGRLLAGSTLPRALFCFNDRMALGAYQAFNAHGMRIPKDIAIVGFDNQPQFAAQLRPALTTLDLPHYEMGAWAVEHLLTLISAGDQWRDEPVMEKKMVCELVERESA